jgi:hypothetical protein
MSTSFSDNYVPRRRLEVDLAFARTILARGHTDTEAHRLAEVLVRILGCPGTAKQCPDQPQLPCIKVAAHVGRHRDNNGTEWCNPEDDLDGICARCGGKT